MTALYKTTVVIWSEYDGSKLDLSSLAYQAEDGDAICTTHKSEQVADPAADPAWDGDAQAFFFGDPPTCILTGEPGENADDCTTHDHE